MSYLGAFFPIGHSILWSWIQTKCIRGGPLGPNILFFASPVKTHKDYFVKILLLRLSYASFGEKNWNRLRHFYANYHKLTFWDDVTKMFWPPFFNRMIFFKFYFRSVNVCMFYFEPNFVDKFIWESGFSNFGNVNFLQNENLFFGRHFEPIHFMIFSPFCWFMVVLGV